MSDLSQVTLPRFASLPGAPTAAPQRRSKLARFFFAPFDDIDDRVARLAAASRAEREARHAAMSAAAALRS